MFSREDLTGKRFGFLTVAGFYAKESGARLWSCNCDCGTSCVIVTTGKLKQGVKKSCGCLHKNMMTKKFRTHGMSKTKEHKIWDDMKARCLNHNATGYMNYGGRGIKVCSRWINSFECFFEDMGHCPDGFSLDRIDVDGDYEPSNCRWATRKQQARNTRASRLVTVDNITASLAEHCERLELRYGTVFWRLKAGWPVEKAFSTPTAPSSKN